MNNLKIRKLYCICLLVGTHGLNACADEPIEQARPPESLRLWCSSPEGYSPHITDCPQGWISEFHPTKPNEARPPLLIRPVQPPESLEKQK
jgi:hypothetical protein